MLHSRPVHVIIVTSIPYMVSLFKVTFQDHSSFKSEILVQQICYIVLPCLPLVWFLGLLPPLEPLLFWSIEQIQIFAFGGSASASPGRKQDQCNARRLAWTAKWHTSPCSETWRRRKCQADASKNEIHVNYESQPLDGQVQYTHFAPSQPCHCQQ